MAFLAAVAVGSTTGGTTASIDTTGAKVLVAMVAASSGTLVAPSDNQGNTWTAGSSRSSSFSGVEQMFYVLSPVTSASHTFTTGGVNSSISVIAMSAASTQSFQTETGVSNDAGFAQPGSITPSSVPALLIFGLGGTPHGTPTADSSFTLAVIVDGVATFFGTALAYLEQGSGPSAVNPKWTNTGDSNAMGSSMMCFVASGGGGGGGRLFRDATLSGLQGGGPFYVNPLG